VIADCARAPRAPTAVELMADVPVGGSRVMPWGKAKSCVTALRKLHDGRRWSLLPAPSTPDEPVYCIVRRA
jgi:hypothetical protein